MTQLMEFVFGRLQGSGWIVALVALSSAITFVLLYTAPTAPVKSVRAIWNAYASALRSYWLLFALMTFVMVVTVCTKYAQPFAFRHILQTLETKGDTDGLVWVYAAVLFAHVAVWAAFDIIITMYATYCMRDAERNTLEMLLRKSARFFGDHFTGSLVTSAKRFRHTLEFVTDQYSLQFGRILTMIVGTLIVFFVLRPSIGWIFLSWIMVYLAANYRFALYRMELEQKAAEADSKTNGALSDALTNHMAIRTYGRESDEQERFDGVTHERMLKQQWADNIGGVVNRLQGILVVILDLMVLHVLLGEWNRSAIPWTEFVFFHTYLGMAIIQLWEVAGAMNKTFKHLGDAEEMAQTYAEDPEVRDAAGAIPLRINEGKVVFHAVEFSYGVFGKRTKAVSKFSLTIEPGKTVAIVGPSGAGKSTLVNLFQRLYDLDSGYITIDGQDIATVTQLSLHQQIAMVPQDPNLFHRSILENILIGRPNASFDDVLAATKQARLLDFIQSLPKGFDTMVGERGVKLSGGQRQRIALARAFLADRRMLVLDEATSALDSITESEIKDAIDDLLKDRTSLVIAHRLSTIMRADTIVVMDKGLIVDVGTHQELIGKKGLYHTMWKHQSGGYLVA